MLVFEPPLSGSVSGALSAVTVRSTLHTLTLQLVALRGVALHNIQCIELQCIAVRSTLHTLTLQLVALRGVTLHIMQSIRLL